MMDSVTHLAGAVVRYENRIIQRCVICGEKLVDNYGISLGLNEDGTALDCPTWVPDTLLRITSREGMRSWIPLTHSREELPDDLPEDSCIELVE